MRASFSWTSWNSPMGWPNCTRSLAYSTLSSRQRSIIPRAIAATPERSMEKVALASSRPPPAHLLGLSQQPVAPDAHVGEEELTRRRRVQAHLAQRRRLVEARHPPVEHEVEDLPLGGRVPFVELADEDDGVGERSV